MKILAVALTALVALEHLGFLGLEMFAWTLPLGQTMFHTTPEFAASTGALAANQGLYNGFLAAGLAFALWRGDVALRLFFLGCVVVAGLFGAATAFIDILFVQALPAALAFAATLAALDREPKGLGSAVHALFRPLGGADVAAPPREPMREPRGFK